MDAADPKPGASSSPGLQIQALWNAAVEPADLEPGLSTAQALAFGVNFRIHLGKALIAAWETSKAVVKGTAAAHAPFAWWAWAEVGAEAIAAAHSIFSSLVQRMRPIDYVTSVILSVNPAGLTEAELKTAVEAFLQDPDAVQLSWHFGMSEGLIKRAREVVTFPDWLPDTLKQLQKDDFFVRSGEKLTFKSHNYDIRWKAD